MTDLTMEALNQMIESAGREDLQVVRASQAGALDRVLTLLQQAAGQAREAVPSKPKDQWTAADETKAGEWLVLDRVTREARAVAEQTEGAKQDGPTAAAHVEDGECRGRVWVEGRWCPAVYNTAGAHVRPTPAAGGLWRAMTSEEDKAFQPRIPDHQRTTGRVWDDAYFQTTPNSQARPPGDPRPGPPDERPLRDDLDALIEDLADPMAHQHDNDDDTDCLACIVRQRLTNITAQTP